MKLYRLSLIPLTLGLALALVLGLCISLAVPGNPDPNPDPNTHTAPLTTTVSITYDEPISAATVSTRTFAVFASQTGLLTATYGVHGGGIVLTPTRALHPGELVQTSATTHTLNLSGERPISYTVWQFRARTLGGSGAFAAHPITLAFGEGNSYALALGDVDGDGDLDAVVVNQSTPRKVYLNDGAGGFGAHPISPTFGAGANSRDIALGDVDGDGDLDALVANYTYPQDVYLNDGTGRFAAHPLSPTFGTSLGTSRGIALGDVDGDGDLDAVVADGGAEDVYLNDGAGCFADHPTAPTFGGISDSFGVALGDVDGDGDLDALVVNYDQPQGVYLNDGTGVFVARPVSPTFGVNDNSYGLALGDLNGDGYLDAVVANYNEPQGVYLNDGTGAFAVHPITHTFGYTNGHSTAVVLGDLDADGDLDAVVANYNQFQDVYLNDGTGRFAAHPRFPFFGSDTEGYSWDVALGDVDGDGDLDALVANRFNAAQTVWLNRNRADLSIAKSVTPAVARPGDFITYTLTFTNHGPEKAGNVVVADDVPGGQWSVIGAHITRTPGVTYAWTVRDLAPGQGGVITLVGQLGAFALDTVFTNTATITATVIDTHTLNNRATTSITIDVLGPAAPALRSPADGTLTHTNALTLTWSASPSPDVAGYWLDWSAGQVDVGDTTVFTTGLLADGVYTWTVAAYDRVGYTSAYTDVWSFTVDTIPPQPPALFSPADGAITADATPTLVWLHSASPDVAGYWLNFGGTEVDVGHIIISTTGVLADGIYTWTVAAYDGAGYTSAFTETWTFRVDTTPPSPPVLVSPAHGLVVSDTTPTLVWQASPSPDVAGYWLDLSGSVNDVGDVTGYTAPFLTDGAYAWRVAAYDEVGHTGVYSDVWTFSVDATPPQVVAVSPPAGAQGVAVDATVVITFSEAVRAASLDYAVLPDPLGWSAAWRDGETVVLLDHDAFAPETTYTVSLVAVADGVGNAFSGAPYAWHFATTSQWALYLPVVLRSP
jgi:uncharacterized repeat protein (TIGR01451 family)